MALDTVRKISFKPTSRRSSHVRTSQDRLARHWTLEVLCRASAQVTQVFGTHRFAAARIASVCASDLPAAVSIRTSSVLPGSGLGVLGIDDRDRGHVGDVGHFGATAQHVHRLVHADQDRSDRNGSAKLLLQQPTRHAGKSHPAILIAGVNAADAAAP